MAILAGMHVNISHCPFQESGSGSAEPANRQFLIEYFGIGGINIPPECMSAVDADNQANCDFEYFSCKCADSRNNTYTCLRTLLGEEDNVFCQFEAGFYALN